MDFFRKLFEHGFIPYGECYFWDSNVVWTHVLSDAITALSCFLISVVLFISVKKRKDIEYKWMLIAFGLFNIGCGLVHLTAVVSIWAPYYYMEGLLKALMALSSVGATTLLIYHFKEILTIPSLKSLNYLNNQLVQENNNHQQTKKVLEENIQKFKLTMFHSPIGMALIDLNGRLLEANQAICNMLGYTLEELFAMDLQALTYPDDIGVNLTLVKKVLKKEIDTCPLEKRYIKKNGEIIWGLLSVSLLRNEKGDPIHFISQIVNIDALKQTEHKLLQSEAKFKSAMQYAPIGKAIFDNENVWLDANDSICFILGYSKNELYETTLEKLTHPESILLWKSQMHKLKNKEIDSFQIEKRYLHKSGGEIWVLENNTIVWEENKIVYLICQIIDISERKKKNIEILELNQSLEEKILKRTAEIKEANQELNSFVYTITHDLRQPLNSITGLINILEEKYRDKLDEQGKYITNLISSNANRLNSLITSVLEFSKAKKTELKKEEFNLKLLMEEVFIEQKDQYKDNKIEVLINDLPLAYGDANIIKQVCSNLLSNALKYSSKNKQINIEIGGGQSQTENIYWVKDNGVGFDNANLIKVFEPFKRLHGTHEFEGNGLGLAVCKKIITKHGGKMWADGNIGKGATFYFSLPKILNETNPTE